MARPELVPRRPGPRRPPPESPRPAAPHLRLLSGPCRRQRDVAGAHHRAESTPTSVPAGPHSPTSNPSTTVMCTSSGVPSTTSSSPAAARPPRWPYRPRTSTHVAVDAGPRRPVEQQCRVRGREVVVRSDLGEIPPHRRNGGFRARVRRVTERHAVSPAATERGVPGPARTRSGFPCAPGLAAGARDRARRAQRPRARP